MEHKHFCLRADLDDQFRRIAVFADNFAMEHERIVPGWHRFLWLLDTATGYGYPPCPRLASGFCARTAPHFLRDTLPLFHAMADCHLTLSHGIRVALDHDYYVRHYHHRSLAPGAGLDCVWRVHYRAFDAGLLAHSILFLAVGGRSSRTATYGGEHLFVEKTLTVDGLNEVIHQPARLRIMAILAAITSERQATFGFLKGACDLTDGNLGAHLHKLEQAGYIMITKTFVRQKPQTYVEITPAGRAAFEKHRVALEQILNNSESD